MKETTEKIKKQATKNGVKGITLIALVLTIIVLIILATVSISMVFGEDGLIARAELAQETSRAAAIEEELEIWRTGNFLGQYLEGTSVPVRVK